MTEGKGESGAFTIQRNDRVSPANRRWRSATSTDSRGYSYTQMAEVGGNIGGDYRLFFKSAPFIYQGKQVRINHTVYLAAPLTFRIDVEVAEGAAEFMHMSPWRYRRASVISVAGVRKTYGRPSPSMTCRSRCRTARSSG